jgi:hypothetical protein
MDDVSRDNPSPDPLYESASKLLSDWRKILCRAVDEAETFTREKPLLGLTAAFFAGAFLSSFFRRRR